MKVMFILDYQKAHYVVEQPKGSGKFISNYQNTKEGMTLLQVINDGLNSETKRLREEGDTNILNKDEIDFEIDYAYNKIPKILKANRDITRTAYKPPTAGELKPEYQNLRQRINDYKPDIIVPMGGSGCKALLGKTTITALRGRPVLKDVVTEEGETHTCYILPTFSISHMLASPSVSRHVKTDFRLASHFMLKGADAFSVAKTTYTDTFNDIGKIREAFATVEKRGYNPMDAIGWDYETNTLRGEMKGSKILTISLSWEEGRAVTIPVEHPEYPHTPENLKEVKSLIGKFLIANTYKVAHNGQFDMRISKQLIDQKLTVANSLDTQVGYYLTVSQKTEDAFGLKTIVYQYTDMGGYEDPLDEYKEWFLKKLLKKTARIRDILARPVEKRTPTMLRNLEADSDFEYPEFMNDSDKNIAHKWASQLLSNNTLKYTQVRNEQDGGNFDYTWIPYRLLSMYAGGDVDACRRINRKMLSDALANNDKLYDLYVNHYPVLTDTLADIEVDGMYVNKERLIEIKDAFDKQIRALRAFLSKEPIIQKVEKQKEKLYALGLKEKAKPPKERDPDLFKFAGKFGKEGALEFKPSGDDLQMALYGETGYTLPIEKAYLKESAFKNLKDGIISKEDISWMHYGTNADCLSRLKEEYPNATFISLIEQYKKLEKLVSTYTQSIYDILDEESVLHGWLKATGTATSRLASRGPK